jgi:hypothetical protein
MELVLVDYTNKDSGGSVTVRYNFDLHEVHELKIISESAGGDFVRTGDKIFGDPDENGMSIARKIVIKREFKRNGEIAKSPWMISISNGKGIKIQTGTGGFAMKSGTYKEEGKAVIYMTNAAARELFHAAESHIERTKLINALEFRLGLQDPKKAISDNANNSQTENRVTLQQAKGIADVMYKALDKALEDIKKNIQATNEEVKELKEILLPEGMPH